MPALESSIDDLYKGPLADFVSARGALAKTLKGDDAKRVKALVKPVVIPWAVNQLYWHARPVYDRLIKSGEKLRAAQIAALAGRSTDVHAATAAHRKAIGEAVAEATALASRSGAAPAADVLTRMLEAISLTEQPAETPGRFTKVVQPAGFEALAGLAIAAATPAGPRAVPGKAPRPPSKAEEARIRREEQEREDRQHAEAERRWRTAMDKAESDVTRAKNFESGAREEWERAQRRLKESERVLEEVRGRQPKR